MSEEDLTDAGRALRSIAETGNEAVRPFGFIPCAREHTPERLCILPDGHDVAPTTEHIHGEGYCRACIEFAATAGVREVIEPVADQVSKQWEARVPEMLQNAYNAGYVKARADAAKDEKPPPAR